MKIRLVLADDHPALIAGVKHELAGVRTIEVAGEARNSTELVDVLSQVSCDVLITDFAMPGGEYGDGMVLLGFLRRRFPELKIIVFTMIDNHAVVRQMAKFGVRSVLNKIDDLSHLILAIHAVYAGAEYYSPTTMAPIDRGAFGRDGNPGTRRLTTREAEVVRLYVSGQSVNEIAAQLNRTKQTVSSQKRSAMRKLSIERDADLFRFAYEMGLADRIGVDSTKSDADHPDVAQ